MISPIPLPEATRPRKLPAVGSIERQTLAAARGAPEAGQQAAAAARCSLSPSLRLPLS